MSFHTSEEEKLSPSSSKKTFRNISQIDQRLNGKIDYFTKASKYALNRNAERFKIAPQLIGGTTRYEIIYKNFLRDLRKFYLNDFNN